MERITRLFLLSVFLLCTTLSVCAIESGKVYRFKNVGKPNNAFAISGATQGAVGAAYNASDLKQQWYVKSNEAGTGFYLRNVANGAYLESPKTTYTQWPVTFTTSVNDDTMLLTFGEYDGHLTIKALSHNNQYAYAHNDGSNNIVCWLNSSTPTQWIAEEVPMTQQEIQAVIDRFSQTGDEIAKASTYQTYLDALFSDKACTQLKESGDLQANPNYQALPFTLKTMVDKVKAQDWAEGSGEYAWDSQHAEKYRVQLYEPYSEGATGSNLVGIQAYTNMNNPTGILGNAGDILYVMVGSQIPANATLYIGGVPDCSMYNGVTSGIKLHEGLNMILCNTDLTHYFIYYTANTIENKQPVRKLSEFPDIKIHIEGGELNGFFNYKGDSLYKPDTKADFEYTTSRAKHPMFDLIGQYVILHFYLEDTPNVEGGTPEICVKNSFNPEKNPGMKHDDPVETMKAWDKMCFAERILLGIQSDKDIQDPVNQGLYETIVNDPYQKGEYAVNLTYQYSDYFNNRMMGINYQAANLYMNATSWRTAYAPSTVSVILSQFPEAGIWGPAHEYGHMNQGLIAIAGTTEESNNVFSNVANYFVCNTTSRCDYPSEQLKHFNNGDTYLQNETWGTTRMFWQLWCYYHAAGKNKKFYPRLFELLRHYPLQRETTTYPGKLNARKDMLHFAKMCCVAAGEDLTNFFASWGFFSPQDTYHIDDYSIYELIVTPEDIQAVKDEIKALNLPKNDAIILIDDRVGSNLKEGFGYDISKCGEYGGINSFKENGSASGSFEFTVDGNNVSVSGNGNPGVGFLIYDENGNLIGFSNSNNFTVSNEVSQALTNGTASVQAVGPDNKPLEVVDPVRDGSQSRKKELLGTLLARCDELLNLSDESLSHVGKIIPNFCTDLKEACEAARFVYNDDASSSDLLTDEYLKLSEKYYELLNNDKARVAVEPGASYRLINHNYTSRALDTNDEKLISSTFNATATGVPFSQQWVLEPASEATPNQFFIRNLGDGKYISTTKKQSTEIPLSESPTLYSFITIEPGVYSFAPDNEVKFGIHIDQSNKVVQWNTTTLPTQWSLVKICSAEQIALRNKLAEKLAAAENLLATCGVTERTDPKEYSFANSNVYTNAPYKGSGSDAFTSWDKMIFDKNINTYFHSNYDPNTKNEDELDHYIRLEAPENGNFRFFNLSYTTRNISNINTNPKSVIIEASSDMQNWRDVFHVSGLPTGQAVTYKTGEICVPEATKYIRMLVPVASSGLVNGHSYFVVSELSVEDLGEPIFTPDEGFPYLKSEEMQKLYDEIIDAKLDLAYSATSAPELTTRLQQIESASGEIQSVMIPAVDVTDISFAVNPIIVKVGDDAIPVTLNVEPENATFPQFDWQIADTSLASIESVDGKSAYIKGLTNGITELKVTVAGNPLVAASAIIKVLPEVPVASVAITPSEINLPLNAGEVSLNATVYPENASIPTLLWTSSDPSVIEVDGETGALTLLRQGVAEILATTTDGTEISAKSVVTVSNPVAQGLMIYPAEASMEPGDELQFSATYLPEDAEQPIITWESTDSSVLTVDPSGIVRALKAGTAAVEISALINGREITATANVTVNPLTLKAVAIDPINMSLEKGNSANLTVTLSPEEVEADLDWNVSDANIISLEVGVDKLSAKVTALKPGMALVTVVSRSNPDLSASCQITVPEVMVTDLKILIDDTFINGSDGKKTLGVEITPKDAPTPRLIWTSSDENIAKVETISPTEAELIPMGNGKTTISVSHADMPEISDSVDVEISGVSAIASLFEDKISKVDVYELSGQIVKKNVDLLKLNNLKPGIYIIRQGKISKEVLVK